MLKIKDLANHVFVAKSTTIGCLVVAPHVPLEVPEAERVPDQEESSQTAKEAPHPTSTAQPSCTFVTISIIFLEKLIADQCQTSTLTEEVVRRISQMIETKVSAAKKEITSQVRKKLGG